MVFRYHSRAGLEYHFQGNRTALCPNENRYPLILLTPLAHAQVSVACVFRGVVFRLFKEESLDSEQASYGKQVRQGKKRGEHIGYK
jgi:hypothetical protein